MNLLKYKERCGCTTHVDGDGAYIVWCSMHGAGPEMYKALIFARDEMVVKTEGEHGAYMAIQDAIESATPKEK